MCYVDEFHALQGQVSYRSITEQSCYQQLLFVLLLMFKPWSMNGCYTRISDYGAVNMLVKASSHRLVGHLAGLMRRRRIFARKWHK
jgi:hypothetical protein